MTDRHLTIVFHDLSQEELAELVRHPKVSALAWGHTIDEREDLAWAQQRLLNERPTEYD